MILPRVRVVADRFLDDRGRQVMLRGVNLGGDCKVPYPDGGTDRPSDFADHREVSFIGRPCPLEEADEHLGRLAHWGFNCVRLLTTWEAVEHAGPGLYDTEYLDYFAGICRRAGEHGLYVFVDFHQDVWSRMSGGDGAPGWTFEAAGLDFTKFHAAGAAHVMQRKYDYADPEREQAAYPPMSWGSNYRLPANAIMWSLFWAGARLTPELRFEGRNIQHVLQGAYLGCVDQIAQRIRDLPNVLGFDSLNEPGLGWIGEAMTHRRLRVTEEDPVAPRIGAALSPLDGLTMAAGRTVEVPWLQRNLETGRAEPVGTRVMNPDGVSIWRSGECPFAAAGAWRLEGGEPVAVEPDFFRMAQGRRLEVYRDGLLPLFHGVAGTMRRHNPDWALFAELDPFGGMSGRKLPEPAPSGVVNAGHWYDVKTLYLKAFEPLLETPEALDAAKDGIRARFVRELGIVHSVGADLPGRPPTLIGEFGIPFDLDHGRAYRRWATGNRGPDVWARHELALELMYEALDELLIHSTQWNYTASNRNDLRIGDGWNQEDLSIFSADQRDDPADPDSGGRAIDGFSRPYAQHVAGRIVAMRFEPAPPRFTLEFDAQTGDSPTEIFLPRRRFGRKVAVTAEGGAIEWRLDADAQRLSITAEAAGRLRIVVLPRQA